jgi:hypothetical protein
MRLSSLSGSGNGLGLLQSLDLGGFSSLNGLGSLSGLCRFGKSCGLGSLGGL